MVFCVKKKKEVTLYKDKDVIVYYKGQPVDNRTIDNAWNFILNVVLPCLLVLGIASLAYGIKEFLQRLF